MPLRFDIEEYLGTNSDNSRSDEFCFYCFKNGEFVSDILMPDVIDLWVTYTHKYNEYSGTSYTPQELRTILNKRLPSLKRWKQKQQTRSFHQRSVKRITTYIHENLFEILDMDELIAMSNLSKYHFRRVFKSIVGENIASYIQRLRIEQIANMLVTTDDTLEQIAARTNYISRFSLAKAFRKHFGVSTSVYRRQHIQSQLNGAHTLLSEMKIINGINLHCLEVADSYKNKSRYKFMWHRVARYADKYGLTGRFVSVGIENPLNGSGSESRFYMGIMVPDGVKALSGFRYLSIPNGCYACFCHKGSYVSLQKLYKDIYEVCLPQSGYKPLGNIFFEIYLNCPKTTKATELETEVYIPVEKI